MQHPKREQFIVEDHVNTTKFTAMFLVKSRGSTCQEHKEYNSREEEHVCLQSRHLKFLEREEQTGQEMKT